MEKRLILEANTRISIPANMSVGNPIASVNIYRGQKYQVILVDGINMVLSNCDTCTNNINVPINLLPFFKEVTD